MEKLSLITLESEFTIHRFNNNDPVPAKVYDSNFYWIGRTDEELSIVCDSKIILNSLESESNWSMLKVKGNLDFASVGILANISNLLSEGGISIIALSTYNTDYFMIKSFNIKIAQQKLKDAGYIIL